MNAFLPGGERREMASQKQENEEWQVAATDQQYRDQRVQTCRFPAHVSDGMSRSRPSGSGAFRTRSAWTTRAILFVSMVVVFLSGVAELKSLDYRRLADDSTHANTTVQR